MTSGRRATRGLQQWQRTGHGNVEPVIVSELSHGVEDGKAPFAATRSRWRWQCGRHVYVQPAGTIWQEPNCLSSRCQAHAADICSLKPIGWICKSFISWQWCLVNVQLLVELAELTQSRFAPTNRIPGPEPFMPRVLVCPNLSASADDRAYLELQRA